jgi:hypothetical protein
VLTAVYRFGVDTGGAGGKVPTRKFTGWENVPVGHLTNDVAGQPRKITCG